MSFPKDAGSQGDQTQWANDGVCSSNRDGADTLALQVRKKVDPVLIRTLALSRLACFAATFATVTMSQSAEAASAGPFRSLEGSWSGAGRILLEGGNSERLSCRANYGQRDGGSRLSMSIRCASSSYKIELRASLASSSGAISGTWEERTFNAGGSVTGRVSGGALNLAFRGNVDGSMAVSLGDRQQRVSITTNGGGFRGVTISLSRG